MLVPRQRVAAYGLVQRHAEVLLVQAPSATTSGRWFLPGGGVEHGEPPEAAVRREFREETGLTVRVDSLLEVLSDVMEVPAENWLLHSIRVIYLVELIHDEQNPQAGDVQRVGWFTREACHELALMPFVAAVLART
jgi:ADP-ribose pyrophosphatase YjhB (NUDIX family)